MINTCLRRMNYTGIFLLRYFIYHLRKILTEHSKNNLKKELSEEQRCPLKNLKISRKTLESHSSSIVWFRQVERFLLKNWFMVEKIDKNQFSYVLFQFDADDDETANYSYIKTISEFPSEHLININIFLIGKKLFKKI